VANGNVKLRSGVTNDRIKPKSALESNGSDPRADLFLYSTGYDAMNQPCIVAVCPSAARSGDGRLPTVVPR